MMAKDLRHRAPYPKAKKKETTDKWKRDVLAWIETTPGMTIPKVADKLGADRKGLWKLLTTDQQTSSHVDALTALTGVDPPLASTEKDVLDRVVDEIEEKDRPWAAAVLRAMLGESARHPR